MKNLAKRIRGDSVLRTESRRLERQLRQQTKELRQVQARLDAVENLVSRDLYLLSDTAAKDWARLEKRTTNLLRAVDGGEARVQNRIRGLERLIKRSNATVAEIMREFTRRPQRSAQIAQLELGVKVNVGPGPDWRREGWTTIDYYVDDADIALDLRECPSLPFDDESVSLVFCSHVIEHLADKAVESLFAEFHRILAPGGVARLATPCFDRALAAYHLGDRTFFEEGGVRCVGESIEELLLCYIALYKLGDYHGSPQLDPGEVRARLAQSGSVGDFVEWVTSHIPVEADYVGHRNAFTMTKVAEMMRTAGFSTVYPSGYRASVVNELTEEGFDNRPRVTLFFETVK